jgi:hypothetical protein
VTIMSGKDREHGGLERDPPERRRPTSPSAREGERASLGSAQSDEFDPLDEKSLERVMRDCPL